MYKKHSYESNLSLLQEVEDHDAVLKRNLTRILKDLEQGTVNKDIPNDAREPGNGCPSSYVEGSGDNGKMLLKKKEEIVPMAVISNKKNPLEPNDEKPTKKEVAIISKEKPVKNTRSSVVTTEKGISTLEQVVTVEKGINMNPGPSNVMDDGKVSIRIDETANEGGKSSESNMNSGANTGMDVKGSPNSKPIVHTTTATEINQSNRINAEVSDTEGFDAANPGPSTSENDNNPNEMTVGPDSAETLATGATFDPKVAASGTVGPDLAETLVTGATSDLKVAASGTSGSKDKKMSQTK